MPYQIIYVSTPVKEMKQAELEAILSWSKNWNASVGITGALVYADGAFLQILQGGKDEVLGLVSNIKKDPRHCGLTVIQAGEIEKGEFAGWDMAYIKASSEQISQWVGSSETADFQSIFKGIVEDRVKAKRMKDDILSRLNADCKAGLLGA